MDLQKLLNKIQSPSKFNPGVNNLWRGNSFKLLNKIIIRTLTNLSSIKDEKDSIILFRSARSGLTAIINSFSIGEKDEIILSAFTCDAVSNAILATGAKPVYVDTCLDLTMNFDDIKKAISSNTKAIIIQNTFGRNGIKEEDYKNLSKNDIIIIEDNCLSEGSKLNGKDLGLRGDFNVSSLEVSKSFCLGWGGIVRVNNKSHAKKLKNYCSKLKPLPVLLDIRNLLQLWVSLLLLRFPFFGGFIIWYFLYGSRLFRVSSREDYVLKGNYLLMGKLSKAIFKNLKLYLPYLIQKSNINYLILQNYMISLGIIPLIIQEKNELIVSPKIPFCVPTKNIKEIERYARLNKIDIDRWFLNSPPTSNLESCKVYSSEIASNISKKIFNIPCYWSMTDSEINSLKLFLKKIKHLCN